MSIETLDDIIEDLANKMGVYGACCEEGHESWRDCRVCFASELKTRLTLALDFETKIATMERMLRESK
jgi:hypothetical protein